MTTSTLSDYQRARGSASAYDDSTRSGIYPLTHPQKRIWYTEQLYPNTPLHNLAGCVTVRGSLDFRGLQSAFNRFVRDHAATRIRLVKDSSGRPCQRVQDYVPFEIPISDLSTLPEPRVALTRWMGDLAKKQFDLYAEPLFRVEFFRLGESDGGYFVNSHHIISDGWSMQVLADAIRSLYRANAYRPEPCTYLDFVERESRYESSPQFTRDRDFWIEELNDVGSHRAELGGTSGAQLRAKVSPSDAGIARSTAAKLGVSLATLYTALWSSYWSARDGVDDLVVGVPVFNRSGPYKRTFGMFTSTMPLRCTLRAGESVNTFVRRLQANIQRCFRHQRYPLDLLLRALPQTSHGRQLIRTVVNVYSTDPVSAAQLDEGPVSIEECYVEHQLFPMYLIVKEWDDGGGIELDLNYKPHLFARREVERIPELLTNAIRHVSCDSNLTVAALTRRYGLARTESFVIEGGPSVANRSSRVIRIPAPRFPTTRLAERETTASHSICQVPYTIRDDLRTTLAERYGDPSTAAVFTSAIALLLARTCLLSSVTLGLVHDGNGLGWGGNGSEGAGNSCLRELCLEMSDATTLSDLVQRTTRGLCSPSSTADSDVSFGVSINLPGSLPPAPNGNLVVMAPNAEGSGAVLFESSSYDSGEIESIVSRLLCLLERFAEDKDARASAVEIVTPAERTLLLDAFNRTHVALPSKVAIQHFFEDTARCRPLSTAIHWRSEVWSYARLNQRANQLAHALRRDGVQVGDVIAVSIERSPELIVAVLAVLKLGAVYLPVDPSYPESRLQFILEDSGARCILGASASGGRTWSSRLIALDDPNSYAGVMENLEAGIALTDLAYLCYTSGSTGYPKGALVEHRSLINRLAWMQRTYPLDTTDVLLQKTSISFDVSLWELLWWTMAGASLCLADPGDERHPERIIAQIERYGVTVIHFVPAMLQAFLEYLQRSGDLKRVSSLRRVFASGEALRADHVELFRQVFKEAATRLVNLYGPTEATIDVTYFDCAPHGWSGRIPIGKPIDNTWIRILDPAQNLQPIGACGELCIGGLGLARGYLNRPDLTAQRFVEDPFAAGERLYRTGDIARWLRDGEIEFFGRDDDQIKLRGFRIELGEVESALRRHDCVADAVVVLRSPSPHSGQLCGYVTLTEACSMESLRTYLTECLPEHMVPACIVPLQSFPLSSNGKIDRNALPAPEPEREFEPARSATERSLAAIWQEVLGVHRIGVLDNFFALGGDSIKVISLLSAAKALGLKLSTEDIYRHPTIRELASASSVTDEHEPPKLVAFGLLSVEQRARLPKDVEDAFPLSMLQLGLIYQTQLNHGTPYYHDVFSYRIQGRFDAGAFARAMQVLSRRHPIFRTAYCLTGVDEPIQVIHQRSSELLEVVDLRALSDVDRDEAVARDMASIRRKVFEWSVPNLVGFHVHLLGDREYLYTIDFHDSALDGWSVNLIHRELFETYYALLSGMTPECSELRTHFREFIALERAALSNDEHRRFWGSLLDGSTMLQLPRWVQPPVEQSLGVGFEEVVLRPGLSDAIKQTAGRLGVPVKAVLLAAHVRVLALLSTQDDIVTGYEYGVRPEAIDAERVIGLFLNTLPLRVDVDVNSWNELILRVHRAEIDLVPHRYYPMAQIKRDRAIEGPLFETVFNFTHFHVLEPLKNLAEFDLTEVKVRAETEFALRAEFSIHPFTGEVVFWLHYHRDQFPVDQVRAMGGYYARALEQMTEDPLASPRSRSLLSEAERRQLLEEFDAPSRSWPESGCFHQLFEQQVGRFPERIAIETDTVQWTYEELNSKANRLAHALLEETAGEQRVVAIAMDRGEVWMASVLACFKAGCVYLPLDLRCPTARTKQILSASDCSLIIAQNETAAAHVTASIRSGCAAEDVNDGTRGVASDRVSGVVSWATPHGAVRDTTWRVLLAERILSESLTDQNPQCRVPLDAQAYIIFTSGSTGVPKGAVIEHAGLANHLWAKIEELQLSSTDVIAQTASQCFDISLWQLLAGALVGGRVAIATDDTVAAVDSFRAWLERHRVSVLEVVPSYLALMLDCGPHSPQRLRSLLVTGDAVSVQLLERWFAAHRGIPVVNAYGPTEAADDICHHAMTEAPKGRVVPVGKPIPNLHIYVVDAHLSLVPLGTVGEICVSGVGVGPGYVNDPERTRTAFVEDPFRPGLRMYRTGDLGRWLNEGVLELSGRRDDQVKVRGHRVELADVESHLHRCRGIKQAAVVCDRALDRLVAFVVAEVDFDEVRIRRELSEHLPQYLIPSLFLCVGELPLSAHGKIARKELVAQLGRHEITSASRDSVPITSAECQLQGLWAEVLKISPELIGRESDFFALGGHSLKAMELSLRTGSRVSISDILDLRTLKALAQRMSEAGGVGSEPELLKMFERTELEELTLVGFTYAGGHAINFKPLFDQIQSRRHDIACCAVELPRKAEAPLDVMQIARRCANEICRRVRTPVVLWGHCSGAVLALEVARLLREVGAELRRVFIGGKVLSSPTAAAIRRLAHAVSPFVPSQVSLASQAAIRSWLIKKTGFEGFDGLSEEAERAIIEAFRHDAAGAARYLADIERIWAESKLTVPLTIVVARDDRLTVGYATKYRNWRRFSDHVELCLLEDGGHYFVKTRPVQAAEVILSRLETQEHASLRLADPA